MNIGYFIIEQNDELFRFGTHIFNYFISDIDICIARPYLAQNVYVCDIIGDWFVYSEYNIPLAILLSGII